jgi:hypothetical protein
VQDAQHSHGNFSSAFSRVARRASASLSRRRRTVVYKQPSIDNPATTTAYSGNNNAVGGTAGGGNAGQSTVGDSLAVGSISGGGPDGDVARKESDDSMVFYQDSKGDSPVNGFVKCRPAKFRRIAVLETVQLQTAIGWRLSLSFLEPMY